MKQSAGILVYRKSKDGIEVFLTHPAGPFWAKKDTWSIPKGELDDGEDHLAAARREFVEETGMEPPAGDYVKLGDIKQGSNKINYIWAVEGDLDPAKFVCESTFTIEWPPNSGRMQEFPENDRAAWFDLESAKRKLFKAQAPFIDRLAEHLGAEIKQSTSGPTSQQSLF
jgi:predicted NUDIX family NTP pyrophosphohydrolase